MTATAPILLRAVPVASLPDADWSATQVAPAATIRADVSAVKRMGAMWRGLDATGAVVAAGGSIDLQLIDVATAAAPNGGPTPALVKGSPVDTSVTVGLGLEYDVSGSSSVTIRVDSVAAINAGVDTVEIYWNPLE